MVYDVENYINYTKKYIIYIANKMITLCNPHGKQNYKTTMPDVFFFVTLPPKQCNKK